MSASFSIFATKALFVKANIKMWNLWRKDERWCTIYKYICNDTFVRNNGARLCWQNLRFFFENKWLKLMPCIFQLGSSLSSINLYHQRIKRKIFLFSSTSFAYVRKNLTLRTYSATDSYSEPNSIRYLSVNNFTTCKIISKSIQICH